MDKLKELLPKINKDLKTELTLSEDEKAILASAKNIIRLLKSLKTAFAYEMLVDITAVDYGDNFEVVYHVMHMEDGELLKIRVKLPKEDLKIPTAANVWKGALVQEREIFDLMGIVFEGHPDLRRILLPEDFEGHPLRKDFKLVIADRFEEDTL